MQLFDELPPGLWLVKRIDRFHFQHNDSESASLDVTLQKLPFDSSEFTGHHRQRRWSEIVGRPPRSRDGTEPEAPFFINRTLLAGFLALIQVGDIYEGARRVAKTPTQLRIVYLNDQTILVDGKFGGPTDAPPGWSAPTFQNLNHFEFSLKGIAGAADSRCIVFRQDGTEYVLPKIVIFQAFYACHSKLVNALCDRPWNQSAKEVISFARYESGITTEIDPQTQSWKIVLQTGLDQTMANAIAMLWFDPYARMQTNALYTDSLDQNRSRSGPLGRSWLAGANIPHRMGVDPFVMHVQGFSLRPFRPTTREEFHERFLITAITGSSWPLKNQLIEWDIHNSGSTGIEQRPSEGDKPYFGGKPTIEGDPDAIGFSGADPSTKHAINEFSTRPFEYIGAPPPTRQQKTSSESFLPSVALQPEDPSSIVSAGNPNHVEGMPAPAAVLTPIKDSSQQFSFLIEALTTLQAKGDIRSYDSIAPDADSDYPVERNGLRCWSLLRRADRLNMVIPKTGWEIIKDGSQKSATDKKSRKPPRYARCVLILLISIGNRKLMLFEIEPNPRINTSAFCMVAFEPTQAPAPWLVGSVLNAIRDNKGVFENRTLQAAFSPLTSGHVSSRKHSYKYMKSPDGKSQTTIGLRSDLLCQWLISLLSAKEDAQ